MGIREKYIREWRDMGIRERYIREWRDNGRDMGIRERYIREWWDMGLSYKYFLVVIFAQRPRRRLTLTQI